MSLHTDTELVLSDFRQLKALGHETRARILRILEDRSVSAKELAGLLDMTHGKIGHHLKVLRDAGLIEVVEERKVRAMTEKLYGLTYKRLRFRSPNGDRLAFSLNQAIREAASEQPFDPPAALFTVRMSPETAAEFRAELLELAERFGSTTEDGDTYGFVGSVFTTETPQ